MLRQYLLGQPVESDLSQVEERLMSDSNLYEELLIIEDELVDEYVHGQMAESDRAAFEAYFLNSQEHQQKVRFARTLSKYIDRAQPVIANDANSGFSTALAERPAPPITSQPTQKTRFRLWPFENPVPSFAWAAVLIVSIAGISWIIIHNLRSAPTPANFLAVTLTPGGPTRDSGDTQTFSVPRATDAVRLQLTLPPPQFREYSVRLLNSAGNSVWEVDVLRPVEESGKQFLNVEILASLLKPDYYRIKLQGRTTGPYAELATYFFQVK